jgi:predicted GIY-YIG superfamily endonuclease
MPVYLIHFDRAYHHARHSMGCTDNVQQRLKAHQVGQGARLMTVIKQANITWRLARVWEGGFELERQLKHRKEAPRLCPICRQATSSTPRRRRNTVACAADEKN